MASRWALAPGQTVFGSRPGADAARLAKRRSWLLRASDLFRWQQANGGVDEFEELGAVALFVGSS